MKTFRKAVYSIILLHGFLLFFNRIFGAPIHNQYDQQSPLDSLFQVSMSYFNETNLKPAIITATKGLALAREYHDLGNLARFNYLLGSINTKNNDNEQALQHFLKASFFYNSLEDEPLKYYCSQYNLGLLMMNFQLFDEAIRYFSALQEVSLSFCVSKAELYINLGKSYNSINHLQKAIENFNLAISSEPGDEDLAIAALENLVIVYTKAENYQKALEINQKVISLLASPTSKEALIDVFNKQGFLYLKSNQIDEALIQYELALKTANKLKDNYPTRKLAEILNNYALTLAINGQFFEAEKYHNQALQLFITNNENHGIAQCHNFLSGIEILKGNYVRSNEKAKSAIQIAEKYKYHDILIESYTLLSEVAAIQNDQLLNKKFSETINDLKLTQLKNHQVESASKLDHRNQLLVKMDEILSDLAKEEENYQQLQKIHLEASQKAQELEIQNGKLELLEKEKQIQKQLLDQKALEQKQMQQSLKLAEQELLTREQEDKLNQLAQARKTQELLLKQKESEEITRLKEIQILEKERTIQADLLKRESQIQVYLFVALMLAVTVILLVFYLLIIRSRRNKKLNDQQRLIESKNKILSEQQELLKKQMDELTNAQDVINRQKDLLLTTGNFGLFEIKISDLKIQHNERLSQIFNQNSSDTFLVYPDLLAFVYDEDREIFDLNFNKTLQGKESLNFEFRYLNPSQSIKYLIASLRPIQNEAGVTTSVVGVVLDISTLKDKEIQLQNKNKELEKINSELDHFVYRTSHNLRAPLTSIMGLVNLLGNAKKPEQKLYLDLINKSVTKLDETIQEINKYSKNARVEVLFEEVDIKNIALEVIESLMFMKNKKFEYQLNIPNDQVIISDPGRLNMIFNNLISNALKYTHPHRSVCKILIDVMIFDQYWTLTVTDQGIGIASEHQKKIFEMFYRATDKDSGSGLGLYIVKESVKKLNGKIEVESELDKGSTFTITIPHPQQLKMHQNIEEKVFD